MPNSETPLALYIHWPFCSSKCPYCDFNSHVSDTIDESLWKEAYQKELTYFAEALADRKVTSIFFGGGTPSLMSPSLVEHILEEIAKHWTVDSNVEITLEANPTSFEAERFKDLKKAGVNRLSLGVQAFDDRDLKFLGRAHTSNEAIDVILQARELFDRYSFDLIYARPGQTLDAWQQELSKAFSLIGDHVSLYQLTIEKGTPFYSAYKKGEFAMPDDALAAELYGLTDHMLQEEGFVAYEVSNYARSGQECRHNLSYWHYEEYLGIGPGAHSRIRPDSTKYYRDAVMMIHAPDKWLAQVKEQGHGIQTREVIDGQALIEELLMMGLRLNKGITYEHFLKHIGDPFDQVFRADALQPLIDNGLLLLDESSIRVSERGRMVLHEVIAVLMTQALHYIG